MFSSEVFEALDRGATVLTGSHRLALYMQHGFDARQLAAGLSAWPTPEILPWPAWIERCCREYLDLQNDSRAALSSWQEQALWERIIGNSPEAQSLLQITATSQSVQETWSLAKQWRFSFEHPGWDHSEDSQAFRRWAGQFRQTCEREGWLDAGSMADVVEEGLRNGTIRPPVAMLAAGFDDITPQQHAVFDVLRGAGCELTLIESPAGSVSGQVVRVPLPDAVAEITAAAQWTRALMQRGAQGPIGVVVPDIGSQRTALERIFSDVLSPGAVLPGSTAQPPFNISLGIPLSEYPMIAAVFLILGLGRRVVPIQESGAVLRSPFLRGAEAERAQRAKADACLRSIGELEVELSTLEKQCAGCPLLAASIASFGNQLERAPRRQTPSRWSQSFSALLDAMGWPGDRTLDSHEYQTQKEWTGALSALATLDSMTGELEYGEALSRLWRIASQILFQPESEAVPVQILGTLEASGLSFEHLWVMGLHDQVWPAAARPAPFLPIAEQRRQNLPHASAERELMFARQLTTRLLASAPDVVVSYPLSEEDRSLGPSPLIREIREIAAADLILDRTESLVEKIRKAARLESIEDNRAPAVPVGTWRAGGTRVFQAQAACPFRAFAEFRLGADPLEAVQFGLSPKDRGVLLHRTLEEFWKEAETQQKLLSMSGEQVCGLVRQCVSTAVAEMARERRSLSERIQSIEQDRLEKLVGAWLELEKTRAVPFTVICPEHERRVAFAGMNVRIRTDRVDRLPDGREVIVDYKTGKVAASAWEGDRPDEPQLPFYCVTNDAEVAGVLFAQIKLGELGFKGIAADASIAPGAKLADLGEQIKEWRQALEQLSRNFLSGRAEVAPKDSDRTCKHCGYHALCRIAERGVIEKEESGGEDDGA